VVVIDNASYHSVRLEKSPSFSTSKAGLQTYLAKNNILFDAYSTKKQLRKQYVKPTLTNLPVKYEIDRILIGHGIQVLRLPPYHCQYNPIGLAWGYCKTFYNKHITANTNDKNCVEKLWAIALSSYTSEMGQHSIVDCERLIQSDWIKEKGNLPVEDIPPIIVNLGESDSEAEWDLTDLSDSGHR
jgi:transposase